MRLNRVVGAEDDGRMILVEEEEEAGVEDSTSTTLRIGIIMITIKRQVIVAARG
jgi:hypothetical protein